MNERLKIFLLVRGLISEGDDDAKAKEALSKLSADDKKVADALSSDEGDPAVLTQLTELGVKPKDLGLGENFGKPENQPANPQPGNTGLSDLDRQADEALARAQDRMFRREGQRQEGIRNLATQAGLDDDFVDKHIRLGTSIEKAQSAAIEALRSQQAPIDGLGGRIVAPNSDQREQFVSAVEDALSLRVGVQLFEETGVRVDKTAPLMLARDENGRPKRRQPIQGFNDFMHLSLVELSRRWLSQIGVPDAWKMDPRQIFQISTDRLQLAGFIGGRALASTTSDFPGIFANVLNKTLLPAYMEEPSTWELWAIEQPVKDFRETRANSLGHIGTPSRVLEGQEYTYGYMGEKFEKLQAFKYGVLVALTWEMYINDDLNAFTDQAFGFSQASKALENDLVYAQVTGNPTLNEDGVAVFNAAHNNLNEGGAIAPSVDALDAMRAAMALQKGIAPKAGQSGRTLNLRMNTVLCPIGLETKIRSIIRSTVLPGATNNEENYEFVRQLKVVADSRFDDYSTTAWFGVAGGRRDAPAMKVAKLRGYETPMIERMVSGSSVDGVTYKLRHICGAGVGDYRPWQRNDGA